MLSVRGAKDLALLRSRRRKFDNKMTSREGDERDDLRQVHVPGTTATGFDGRWATASWALEMAVTFDFRNCLFVIESETCRSLSCG